MTDPHGQEKKSPGIYPDWSLAQRRNSIRVLAPDHMSCLVPDPARVEHMPIRRLSNDNPVDRIPNACPPALNGPLTTEKIAVPPERKN
jgi:hypothetical protein